MSRPVAASSDEHLFAVCGPGLERVLADECRQLGATRVTEARGGVELEGPRGLHRRLNLQLRAAPRLLLEVAQVRARDASQLERALSRDLARTFAAPDTAVTIDVHAK